MEPNLKNGSKVLVLQWFMRPKVGGVYVYRMGKEYFVKRLAQVVDGQLMMMGDNQSDSLDSIKLGAIKRLQIIGKVV